MKVLAIILASLVLVSFILYGLQQRGDSGMRFIPVGGSTSDTLKSVNAPGFSGGQVWLNSEALDINDLRGKVVLVDFWTYSCINCQRTFPYLRAWWDKYKDRGLVIVGVHSPEFEFEKDTENVREAMQKYGVAWPVVQDNDFIIWRAYNNHFWPHKYLVDQEGKIVYDHIGEGAYEETEKRIQELLGVDMAVTEEPKTGAIGFGMGQTPELYVSAKGRGSGHLGRGRDRVQLLGDWQVAGEFSSAGKGARLMLDFKASEVNLVMSAPDSTEREVGVVVDGKAQEDLTVGTDDLYPIWQGEFGRHVLEMEFDEGVRVHAFTFGS